MSEPVLHEGVAVQGSHHGRMLAAYSEAIDVLSHDGQKLMATRYKWQDGRWHYQNMVPIKED